MFKIADEILAMVNDFLILRDLLIKGAAVGGNWFAIAQLNSLFTR